MPRIWAWPSLFVIAGYLYFVSVLPSQFVVKRGLFLGRDGKHAAYPGGQKGAGLYGEEAAILSRVSIRAREHAVDIYLQVFSAVILIASAASGPNTEEGRAQLWIAFIWGAFVLALATTRFHPAPHPASPLTAGRQH